MRPHFRKHERRQSAGNRFGGQGGTKRHNPGESPSQKPPARSTANSADRGEQRLQRTGQETILEGVVQHHGSFAFLLTETEGGSDVFLRGRSLDLAMDGDRVRAKTRREANGRFSGEIICVLKRARTSMVGILKHSPKGWAVFPEKGFAPPAQVSGFAPKVKPAEGAFAVLQVTRWPTADAGAAGTVTEVLGEPDNVRVRITALLRARDIIEDFPKEVLAQSSAFGSQLESAQWKGREELFGLPIVTIDGADAKDFDDAVSLERLGGDMVRLGVHIADVGHYVKTGSALDKEAYLRGTSVYLPDRVVPMLPPALSNNLCSLVPGQPRLTLSAFMDINTAGKVTRRRLAQTVIRSCRRFTYEEVQSLLDGQKVGAVPRAAEEAVTRMGELAAVLYKVRVKRGALDFNLPEYKIETDAQGRPLRVVLRPRLQSHRLIEEFMLLANESVATELMAAKMPFLHRRHDAPDPKKLKALAETLGDMGLSAGHILGGNTHKGLQEVLCQAQGNPLEDIINSLIVRSMRQAVYSPQSSGHFGIAARAYSHFTSPIRRYPDLMTHRAVTALLFGKRENHGSLTLDKAGVHCSERERAAAEAEHKAVDILRAELFKSRIGSVMNGTVTAVTESGAFVRLGDTGAEGLLRGARLKPGAKISVTITAVDAAKGQIDLSSSAQQANIPPEARW
ncbi:MAG: hypothetical protein A2X34_05090, partial [Elusimicrobia bacterium GWC2_51_8]